MNLIKHKCPVCGYETDFDYQSRNFERVLGDEDFIVIESGLSNSEFPTDVEVIDYGYRENKTVVLLGCPKCKAVSFKI